MSRLNYKTIISYTPREYDDQPSWNVHIHDNTGHPITIKDVGEIQLIQRTDYNIRELTLLYFKKRRGAYGESYTYLANGQEQINPENIILERDDTHEQYNCYEYEEYLLP